jgi:hypothetical protein
VPVTAVLDACVLYPARVRDLLLSLGAAPLFRPIWSNAIHEEWITNVLSNRPDLTRAQLERTRYLMNQAFPDALVRGFEPIISTFTLPDPGDRHVLAAAIYARADLIITTNANDFPAGLLDAHRVTAMHPDLFVDYLFAVDEDEALTAISKMRNRLRSPSMMPQQFIESIEKVGPSQTAHRLRANSSRI